MNGRWRFAKNAAANVVNGLVAAVLSIVLPHFFVHDFSRPEFSLWILILQLGNFVNVLNFGLSVAIGRHVALHEAQGDQAGMERITGAGVQLLAALAVLGMGLILIVDVLLPHLYRQIDPALRPVAQATLLWVGGGLALGLPFSGLAGAMIGRQRNEVPAAVNALGKTALGFALAITAARTHDLVTVAQVFFVVSAATYALQVAAFAWLCRGCRLRLWGGLGAARAELARYCVSLSVWSVSMLLVTGVDTSIVGVFDYRAVAAYGLAANLGVFFSGAVNVAMNPLIQVFAGQHARGEIGASMRLLRLSSYVGMLGLVIAGLWMVGLAHTSFTLWVGPALAAQAFPFFCMLVVSNTVRNSGTPYSLYLLGSGQQQRVILTPLLEGLANLLFSVAGASAFGAIGVAAGAVIGACVGITANFLYNMPRTLPAGFGRLAYFRDTLVGPSVLGGACLALILWLRPDVGRPFLMAGGVAAGCCLSAWGVFKCLRIVRLAV